jgi:hypothetical protein
MLFRDRSRFGATSYQTGRWWSGPLALSLGSAQTPAMFSQDFIRRGLQWPAFVSSGGEAGYWSSPEASANA